jgi:Flp pilus assembly protein TadG
MKQEGGNKEKGQSLIIITLLLLVFLGMMAFVIDGGMSYANRRSAQNAADAGALAGANELCKGNGAVAATNRAIDYAVNKNKATSAIAIPDLANLRINVTTKVGYNTFFANILGRPVMTVTAESSAGCYSPCSANKILPVSWACEPPVTGSPGLNSCSVISVPEGTTDPPLYIVMDTRKTSDTKSGEFCRLPASVCAVDPTNPECDPSFGVNCDTDGDGYNDNISPGDRGWLSLDGSSGNPKGWMSPPDFYDGAPVYPHTWDPVMSGAMDAAFSTAADYLVGEVVLIPVVDRVCDKGIPEINCPGEYDSGDTTNPGSGNTYWRIIKFSAFKITCVNMGSKDYAIPPETKCTAADLFRELNPQFKNQYKSIEGYFVKDYNPNLQGKCGICNDVSPCTIYLDK